MINMQRALMDKIDNMQEHMGKQRNENPKKKQTKKMLEIRKH